MSFKEYNRDKSEKITRELASFLDTCQKSIEKDYPKIADLTEKFMHSVYGGKMIRGTLVYLGYELTGATENKYIAKPAAAFELLQIGFLVQDDIIDQSPKRRGKPSLYIALGGNFYAYSQTIVLGDIGYFLAHELVATANFDPLVKNKAVTSFAQTATKTALGEILDVYLPEAKEQITEEDVIKVAATKSGYYSVTSPLLLGAILGNADEKLLNKLNVFGENLGIAFQLQDDLLGIYGNEENLGKSVLSDIQEGKQTLLYIHALSNANEAQKKQLEKIYGNKNCRPKDAEIIKDIFEQTGAKRYTESKKEAYAKKAVEIIAVLSTHEEQKQLLKELVETLIIRNK